MIRQNSINASLSMSELCSFLCFKLYSLNFALAHAQKYVLIIRIGHTCVALKHKKTDLSLETTSEINSEFIKFENYRPLTKTNREY